MEGLAQPRKLVLFCSKTRLFFKDLFVKINYQCVPVIYAMLLSGVITHFISVTEIFALRYEVEFKSLITEQSIRFHLEDLHETMS